MLKFGNKFGEIIYCLLFFLIICIGLFLRTKLYLYQLPVWYDEVALCLNIFKKAYIKLPFHLEYLQAAPPLYLILMKSITSIFGKNILTLRFISYLAGCASLILFIPVLKTIFKNKIPIILSLFLFAICQSLVYYSQEIKPYSTDVFFCILILFLINKADINNLKNSIISGLLVFLIPLFSFSSVFIIFAALLYKIFKAKRDEIIKYILYMLIPFAVSVLILYLKNRFIGLAISQQADWTEGYMTFSINSFINIISRHLSFMGFNSTLTLVLYILGVIMCIISKDEIPRILLISFILYCIASFLHLYPFIDRASLFFIPISIIFICFVFNYNYENFFNNFNKKIFIFFISALILFYFLLSINIFDVNNFILNNKFIIKDVPKQERLIRENDIITILDNFNENDKIMSAVELYTYLMFYNIMNNYNYKLHYANHCNNFDEIKKIVNNNDFNNFWIITTYNVDNIKEINYENEYETILNNAGVKYKKYSPRIYYVENQNHEHKNEHFAKN